MEKISINFDDNSNKTISFQVLQEEKEVDIHIYTHFKGDFKVCIINPNNKRTKFISQETPTIRNQIDNVKIKSETYIFNENSPQRKIRITLFTENFEENIGLGEWKLLFIPKEEIRGTINIYINYLSSSDDIKKLMKKNRESSINFDIAAGNVILYKPGFEDDLKKIAPNYEFMKISDEIGVLFIDVNFKDLNSVDRLMNVLSIPSAVRITDIANLNTLSIISQSISNGVNANEEIGVNFFKYNPNLSLTGKGVLIGIIDTGIDYLHPDFIYDNNTSKIAYIWDQSKDGKTPKGFYIGSEYTKEDINQAIINKDKSLSTDEEGSGTMLAGICAGMGKVNNNYVGIAEEAELIVVKMATIDGYYNNAMLSAAYEYVIQKAAELHMPVVVNIGFGSNSLLGASNRDLTDITFFTSDICLVNAVGNEGNTDTHASGKLLFKDEAKYIELEIEDFEEDITIEIWINKPDIVRVSIISPSGEPSKDLDVSNFNTIVGIFNLESTPYLIKYIFPTTFSGQQQISINLKNVKKGVWKIRLSGEYITNGIYNAYLENRVNLKPGTKFVDSNPDTSINYPATFKDNITVGAYNTINNSLWPSSSRGFTVSNLLKPDIVAPGVNIIAPFPGGGYATITGTAPAVAYTSGCVALLLQYTSVNGFYPRLAFVQKIRTFLRAGATRFDNIEYPNNNLGYGILNIKGAFNQLR